MYVIYFFPHRVIFLAQLNGYDFLHYEKRNVVDHLVEWNSLSPISLTEEWLTNLGFDKLREHDFGSGIVKFYGKSIIVEDESHEEKLVMCLSTNQCEIGVYNPQGEDYNYVLNKDVEYVHQLQNLYFALTGKELLIK